jgi:MFS family permease
MATASAFSFFGATAALVFLPETSQWRSPASELSRPTSQEDKPPDVPQLISATALLGVNRLVVAGIMIATFGRYLADMLGSVVTIGQKVVGVATITGLALGLSTLIGMVAAPAAGRLSDSYKSRWGVASGGLTSGLTGFSLLAIGSPIAIILGLPLVSVSSGSNQGLSTALIGDLSPRIRHGRRLGILFTVGDLASAIGPPLAYALLPIIGLSAIYGASAGLIGVMLLIALWWTRKARMTLARAG